MEKFNFIIVDKVIKDKFGELSSEPEMIRIDEIKSCRVWYKTDAEQIAFKHDITMVYMRQKDNNNKEDVKAIKIVSSLKAFNDRVNGIQNLQAAAPIVIKEEPVAIIPPVKEKKLKDVKKVAK